MLIAKKSQLFFDLLINNHCFQLNHVGKHLYHLEGDVICDSDGTQLWGDTCYVKKMIFNYDTRYGTKPNDQNISIEEISKNVSL
jgi:hypothetical protein